MKGFNQRKKNIVFFPQSMKEEQYIGLLYGKYNESTGIFNIIQQSYYEILDMTQPIGKINSSKCKSNVNELIGYWEGDNLKFFLKDTEFEIKIYSLYQNIFSRNTGILESKIMKSKCAVILGCGSVGSLVSLELARAGIGSFVLVDHDILEYHNVCRHQCSIVDVGEFKVIAVKKRILAINPKANVITIPQLVEQVQKEVFDTYCINGNCIFVGCADNRAADVYANSIAVMYKAPFISIGFWERAFAGEIFYYLPNSNMPCYKCAIGNGGDFSQRTSTNRRIYTNQDDLSKINFEPGISVDINFVVIIGIKLILDILNIDSNKFTPRLLDSLQQYTLVCNTNKVSIGGEMAEIFSYPLQVTTSLKVGFSAKCSLCEYG